MLRFATTSNKGSQTDASAHVFAESVAKRTAGRIRIEIYESGSLGGEKEIAEEVVGGSLDFAVVSSAGYAGPGVLPSLGVFDVPFLFRDVAHARAVLDGPIGTAKLREMCKAGVVGLAWAENGVRHLTTRDRAVRTPADLAALKIRVPQSEVLVSTFKALGAEPTPIPFPTSTPHSPRGRSRRRRTRWPTSAAPGSTRCSPISASPATSIRR